MDTHQNLNRTACVLVSMLWTVGIVGSHTSAQAADSAKPADALASWTLATADTKMTIGVAKDHSLCIYELCNMSAAWNWTGIPSQFPLFGHVNVDGMQQTLQWTYRDGTVDTKDGTRVTIRFVSAEPAMELTSIWHAHSGPGPVRHTMFIKNASAKPLTICEQESLDMHVVAPETNASVWCFNDDGWLPDKNGIYHDSLADGYHKTIAISETHDWIPYVVVDANGQNGMYVGWEWSIGRLSIISDGTAHGVRLMAGNGNNFRTDLAPGETFEVPPAFVGAYHGDLDDAGNRLRKYLFQHNMPETIRKDPGYPKVEWNAFAPTGKGQGSWDPTEKKYYPFIDDIAPLGFEEVVIDIGWWSSYGDPGHMVTDAEDWPSGMAAAAKYAHDRGIRFGLYDNESEDLTTEAGRKERISDITFLIRDLKADFYRSDATAGAVFNGTPGPDHRSHYPEDAGYWAAKGFYEVLDTLYATIPGFLWEDCSNGGRIKDFGASKRAAKIQSQDRYYPVDARQSFYDSSYVFPPMQLAPLVGSWAEWQAAGSVYEFRSCALGAADWHPDAPNGGNGGPVWSAQQKADIQKAVATYKNKLRPLIRNADLYHILPRPDGKAWDGMEYFDSNAKQGVAYLFKPAEGPDTMKIRLRGLNAKARYRVTFEDGSNPSCEKSGEELAAGIDVVLKGQPVSELMFFEECAAAEKR